jgi:hypothetical protein
MAFKVGSAVQANIPAGVSASRGSHLTSNGTDSAFWAYMGSTSTPAVVNNAAWLYRSIYTHGYLAGGYKGSNPWRSVNKMWHPTETTMYCGEQLSGTAGYTNGVWSDHNGYIIITGWNTLQKTLGSYSLTNGTIRAFSADGFSSDGVTYGYVGNDPKNEGLSYGTAGFANHVGGMALGTAKKDCSATQDIKNQAGYFTGGGDTSCYKMHFPTEITYVTTAAPASAEGDASYGETKGFYKFSTTYAIQTFATNAWTSGGWGPSGGTNLHDKMMGSKAGHFYASTGSNVALPKHKCNQTTGVVISTFNKVRAHGEDNSMDGQDNGYILGHYDGQQNNHTMRQSYSTDIEVTLGANAMPKGHYGQSSGACSTGAATLLAAHIIL